ncbi:MAG: hypothetical protein A2015_08020 [Spirochaetes bacterium GWF1_31_7]|nr:MAG: hypothetical protein A2Y30_02110 [Spirochaetes bacterium GWE1_32_154]OHD46986.1 MAG: hypothetical protein A2015_08020 [Spirochaetes bacterium GWF1_31_7]OHD49766.1 MAG: hypothetical protein A2Y29_06220 [Spirochaetes bacterium GWE2_31_10]HBD95504.1 hypothetical protein [Spirochaetia bacterium]HBI36984.1 hypothetical protein [Spirochaetia bacterium]
MKHQTHFLHTPPGSKPLYKEEALFRNSIEKKLTSFFEKWNYFPVETPMIDYFDIYSHFLSEKQKKGSVRFINRDGDLVLLRNDITLFAAKSLASRGNNVEETLKYYYSDQIVRCQAKDSPEEYFQIGCEIVSTKFTYEEIEILVLLLESADELKLSDYLVHIGDISLYNELFKDFSLNTVTELLSCIRVRNIQGLKDRVKELNISKQLEKDIILISSFIGSLDEFSALPLSEKAQIAVAPLKKLCLQLNNLGYGNKIVIDPSELSELNYYNGIIFHLYAKGAESPLVSGGRYDTLFTHLGLERNAVGFSYWLYPLEKLLNAGFDCNSNAIDIEINDNTVTGDIQKAIQSVKSGKKINLKY